MHYRYIDELVGSAPGASPEFQFGRGVNIQQILNNKDFWKFFGKFTWNLQKIIKISKN